MDPFDSRRRWLASDFDLILSEPRVFVSEDSGSSWRLATAELPEVLALAPDPGAEGRILAGTQEGLFVSDDGGEHWSHLGSGLPEDAAVHQFARDARSGGWYAATSGHGIYRSLDDGLTWTLLAGAPDVDAPAIAVDPRLPTALLAAFRGQGIWRWTP